MKINKSAEKAQQQIYEREYINRYSHHNLPIVTVAINFSTESHTITDWIISE